MKRIIALLLALVAVLAIVGCSRPADVASQNVSNEADQFHVLRRITVINGITDKYLLTIEGWCSIGNYDSNGELSITCKVGDNQYKKTFIEKSDNVVTLVEQLDAVNVSSSHYEVIFQPTVIVPDVVIP